MVISLSKFEAFSSLFTALLALMYLSCTESMAQKGDASEAIRLNQIGYYPEASKRFVVVEDLAAESFILVDAKTEQRVFEGQLSPSKQWELAGHTVRTGDFSSFGTSGTYRIYIEGTGYSHPFYIGPNVLEAALLGSIKGLYYQRASTPLEEAYAGKWYRAMGHPDDSVLFHPSSGKTEGTLNSPGGWYDAGDYNKYIVNACFPLGHFFLFQEQYPEAMADNILNIPKSGNGTSDYLDELRYEMDWALTMQDDDGGLFHKLTTKNFEGMTMMPSEADSQRYIVGKGTAATLDFAAAAAQASRIFLEIDPDYSEKCLVAAKKAYAWALNNPDKAFSNPEDISTGEYGDTNFDDEWFWADAELFLTTEDATYLEHLEKEVIDFEFRAGESWTAFMRFLGMFSLLEHPKKIPSELYETLKSGVLKSADALLEKSEKLPYFQPIDDFQWGSNSDVLNAAMIMATAYRLTENASYLKGVQQAADYVLGNNAMGYSFLTGFGKRTPMFIHHRQSAADGIPEPVPGLLSGGPNSRMQDSVNGAEYPEGVAPMQAWVDQEPSYASNEICLNWNAPLTYILGFLEQESE